MTKQEFLTIRSRLLEGLAYRTLAALAIAAVMCFFSLHFFLRPASPMSAVGRLTGLALPLVFGFGVPLLLRYLAEARARRLHITCPRCGASLLRDPLRGGLCSHCQNPVFPAEGETGLPSAPELFDRMNAFDEANERWTTVCWWTWGSLGAVVLVTNGVFALKLIPQPSWLDPLAGVLAAFAIGLVVFGAVRWQKLVDVFDLRCPNCNDPLVGGRMDSAEQSVVRTGRCLSCGAPVIKGAIAPHPTA